MAASIAAAFLLVWLVDGGQNDFIYDWLSSRAFAHGVDPYQPIETLALTQGLVSGQTLPHIHPRLPGALLIQSPLGWMPYETTYIAGRLLVVTSSFFLAWVVSRLGRFRVVHTFAAVPLLLLVWPFSNVLFTSQTGFLVAGLIGLTWLLGDRWQAGLPLAVAVTLKMWPWLLIPSLWLSGRRRAAFGAMGGFIALNLIGLPFVRLDGLTSTLSGADSFRNYSISSELGIPTLVAATLALIALWWLSTRTELVYAWGVALGLAAAPFVWQHYLPVILIPLVMQFRVSDAQSGVNGRNPRSLSESEIVWAKSVAGSGVVSARRT